MTILFLITGNLTIETNTRRLVPEVVKGILHSYFPKAPIFANDIEPCNICRVSRRIFKQNHIHSNLLLIQIIEYA